MQEKISVNVHLDSPVKDSRGQLRHILAAYLSCQPSQVPLQIAQAGRPVLPEACGVSFSVSHSQSLWAVAVSSQPVGFDLECVQSRRYQQAIVARYFSAQEQAWWREKNQTLVAFYQLWTAKEAYLKYCGVGIASGLSQVRLDLSQSPWLAQGLTNQAICTACPIQGAIAHVATASDCTICLID